MNDARKQSLARLLEAGADNGAHGPAAVARCLDATDQQINNWKNRGVPHAKTVQAQKLWGISAQWIATGEGPKWLPRSEDALTPLTSVSHSASPDLVIAQFDTSGAMGHGFNLQDRPPGMIKSWRVDREWLRLNVPGHTGVENLAIVTGFGPSMRPMFNPGDPILVDRGITKCDVDGVYFFRVDGEGFIKRLQRIPGEGILVISENSKYRDWTIKPSMEFQVLGKVLTVWRSEQF